MAEAKRPRSAPPARRAPSAAGGIGGRSRRSARSSASPTSEAWDATTSWPVVQDRALRARGDDRMGNALDPTLRGTPITVSIAHFVEREDDHERIARHGRIIPPAVGLR
jgi:hypothetical protein